MVEYMVIKMLPKERRPMHKYNENFNKEIDHIRKYQTEISEMKHMIIEPKNSIEGFKSRLDEVENKIRQKIVKT